MKDKPVTYVGLHQDHFGGMTQTGRIILDAQAFGLIPEEETGEGWNLWQIEQLYDKVFQAWKPYGHLVHQLPTEVRQRHERVYHQSIERARALGTLEEDE